MKIDETRNAIICYYYHLSIVISCNNKTVYLLLGLIVLIGCIIKLSLKHWNQKAN